MADIDDNIDSLLDIEDEINQRKHQLNSADVDIIDNCSNKKQKLTHNDNNSNDSNQIQKQSSNNIVAYDYTNYNDNDNNNDNTNNDTYADDMPNNQIIGSDGRIYDASEFDIPQELIDHINQQYLNASNNSNSNNNNNSDSSDNQQNNTTATQQHHHQQQPEVQYTADDLQSNKPLCVECASIKIQQPYYDAFHIPVCYICQRGEHAYKYELITKTTAKQDYLIDDNMLLDIPFMLKQNPQRSSFSNMKLYRKQQIEQIAFNKYGDMNGIENEKSKRDQVKVKKLEIKHKKQKLQEDKEKRMTELYNKRYNEMINNDNNNNNNKTNKNKLQQHEHNMTRVSDSQSKCIECGFVVEEYEL